MTPQEEWDLLLVTAFFRAPFAPMNAVYNQFQHKDAFKELKRTQPFFQRNQAVSAFVEYSLPSIHKALKKYGEINAEKIAKKISTTNIDTKPMEGKNHHTSSEYKEMYKMKGWRIATQMSIDAGKLHNRSAWHVCKK